MKFEFTVLGSSSALPTVARYPSAHVLNVHERIFLIDCGEGTQLQLRRYRFNLSRINHIFISHIHGDHTFGLLGLLSSCSLLGRTNELNIYCPIELRQIIKLNMELYKMDLKYEIVFHILGSDSEDVIFEDKSLVVKSFPLRHRVPCWGFVFIEKQRELNIIKDKLELYSIPIKKIPEIKAGANFVTNEGEVVLNKYLTSPSLLPRSFAYCTDTKYLERIVPIIKGVDLLYHEATFSNIDKKLAKSTYHSTSEQAAKIAEKAAVKKLVVGHFSSRYKKIDKNICEARAVFKNTEAANDGAVFKVEENR